MPAQAIIDNFQTTVGTGGIDAVAMSLPVSATFPVEARGQNLLLRVEDASGGLPVGTNVEHMMVTVPANGVGPVTVVARPIAPTAAAPHAAGSIITAIVSADTMRGAFMPTLQRVSLFGMRGMTFEPIGVASVGTPDDAVDTSGRYTAYKYAVTPSDAPLASFVTYLNAAAPVGLTWCKAYVCDAETYKVLGRTAELVAGGYMATSGRKEWPLTADAGASLVIPRDVRWLINVFRFVGTAVPQFIRIEPATGSFASGQEWGWVSGYGAMAADPAANALFSAGIPAGSTFNPGWNVNIWSGVK